MVALALLVARRGCRPAWAGLFLLVLALEVVLVHLPEATGLAPEAWEWNWVGRALSLVWVAVFCWRGPLTRHDLGLRWRIRPGTGRIATIVGLALLALVEAGIISGGADEGFETGAGSFLYHVVLDTAAEELVYRGVLLALLAGSVGGLRDHEGRFRWSIRAVLVIATIASAYALDAALTTADGLVFDVDTFVSVLIARSVFAWLRLYTGSLLVSAAVNASGNLMAFTLLALVV